MNLKSATKGDPHPAKATQPIIPALAAILRVDLTQALADLGSDPNSGHDLRDRQPRITDLGSDPNSAGYADQAATHHRVRRACQFTMNKIAAHVDQTAARGRFDINFLNRRSLCPTLTATVAKETA